MPTSSATPSLPATEGSPCQTAPEAGPSKLESFYLNSGFGYHISSLVMKAQELAISHEVLQKKLWHMAASQWINQKQQRHALEQRICLQLGPQQQVAYVDCASYDNHETLMKSTVEQPPTTTDTAREATFKSAVFGTHEDLHLTMRLSQCFKHSTHQVKILQTMALCSFLLGSTATPLQVMERHCRGVKGSVSREMLRYHPGSMHSGGNAERLAPTRPATT